MVVALLLSVWLQRAYRAMRLCLPTASAVTARCDALTADIKALGAAADTNAGLLALRTQLDYVRYRVTAAGKPLTRSRLFKLQFELSAIARDIGRIKLGVDPVARRHGVVLRGYLSPIDGTLQPYSVAVPLDYDGSRPYPLIVNLHAHGWYRPFQGYPPPAVPNALVVSPHARGSQDYMLISERDVMAVIDEVCRLYRVDPDRITLMGSSMGGTGCWNLAVHHPDRFAAIAPESGNTDQTVWEKLWDWGRIPPSPMAALRQAVTGKISPIVYAENLEHVPVFCVHGDEDTVVPVEHARNMVHKLRALGYRVIYREYPGYGHGGFPEELFGERVRWLLEQRRVRSPRHVRFVTGDLDHCRDYWVCIDAIPDPLRLARIDASIEGDRIVVHADNVSALTLNPPSHLLPAGGIRQVQIGNAFVNVPNGGNEVHLRMEGHGWAVVASPSVPGLMKRPGLCGPVAHAFLAPFLVVYGTGGSAVEAEMTRRAAEGLVHEWQRRYGKPCRIKADAQVTAADITHFHLVLFGNADTNSVLHRLSGRLPIQVDSRRLAFAGRVYRGADTGTIFCFPNPLQPDHYAVVFAGITWRGLFQIHGRFGNWFEWGPYDNYDWFDYVIFDQHTGPPESVPEVGFFDSHWRFALQWHWFGVPAFRDVTPPFRIPPLRDDRDAGAELYLSDLMPEEVDQARGVVGFDRSFGFHQLHVGNQLFRHGLGVRPPARIRYHLHGRWSRFCATVGLDPEGESVIPDARREVERIGFAVYGDGHLRAESPDIDWSNTSYRFDVDIEGVHELELVTEPRDWHVWLFGSAAWGDARLIRTTSAGAP